MMLPQQWVNSTPAISLILTSAAKADVALYNCTNVQRPPPRLSHVLCLAGSPCTPLGPTGSNYPRGTPAVPIDEGVVAGAGQLSNQDFLGGPCLQCGDIPLPCGTVVVLHRYTSVPLYKVSNAGHRHSEPERRDGKDHALNELGGRLRGDRQSATPRCGRPGQLS